MRVYIEFTAYFICKSFVSLHLVCAGMGKHVCIYKYLYMFICACIYSCVCVCVCICSRFLNRSNHNLYILFNWSGFSKDQCEEQKNILLTKMTRLEEEAYYLAGHTFSLTSTEDVSQVTTQFVFILYICGSKHTQLWDSVIFHLLIYNAV